MSVFKSSLSLPGLVQWQDHVSHLHRKVIGLDSSRRWSQPDFVQNYWSQSVLQKGNVELRTGVFCYLVCKRSNYRHGKFSWDIKWNFMKGKTIKLFIFRFRSHQFVHRVPAHPHASDFHHLASSNRRLSLEFPAEARSLSLTASGYFHEFQTDVQQACILFWMGREISKIILPFLKSGLIFKK